MTSRISYFIIIFLPALFTIESSADTRGLQGVWEQLDETLSVIECGNVSRVAVEALLSVKDNQGQTIKAIPAKFKANGTNHFALEELKTTDKFGTYTIKPLSDGSDIVCQTIVYKRNKNQALEYSFSLPMREHLEGNSWGLYDLESKKLNLKSNSASIAVINMGLEKFTANIVFYSNNTKEISGHEALTIAPHARAIVNIDSSRFGTSGIYEIVPDDDEIPYEAFSTRELSNGIKKTRVPLLVNYASCHQAPVTALTKDGSVTIAEIGNASAKDIELIVEIRNESGEIVHSEPKIVPSQTSIRIDTSNYLRKNSVGSFRAYCKIDKTVGEEVIIQQSITYHTSTSSKKSFWAFPSQPPRSTASSEDKVVSFVNTYLSAVNKTIYHEETGSPTECIVDLFKESGILFSQNSLNLLPKCNVGLNLEEQTGADFLGLSISETDNPLASYSVETTRIYPDINNLTASIMNTTGFIIPKEFNEKLEQLEPILCGSGGKETTSSRVNKEENKDINKAKKESLVFSNAGYQAAKDGKYLEAIKAYKKAMAVYPKSYCAMRNLARTYAIYGNLNEATKILLKLKDLLPGTPSIILDLAGVYYLDSKPNKAIEILTRLLKDKPNYIRAHAKLGMVYVNLKNFEKGLFHYNQALELGSNLSWLHGEYCWALLEKGDYPAADKACKRGLELNPNSVMIRNNLGVIFLRTRQTKEAIKEFKKAIEIDPTEAFAYINLAYLYSRKGQINKAEELYATILKFGEQEAALLGIGKLAYKRGDINGAVGYFGRVVKMKPMWIEANFNLANALAASAELEKAREQYMKVLELDKKHIFAYAALIQTVCNMGDEIEAKNYYDKLVLIDSSQRLPGGQFSCKHF